MENRKKVTFSLPKELVDELANISTKKHLSKSVIVQISLQDYIEKLYTKVEVSK